MTRATLCAGLILAIAVGTGAWAAPAEDATGLPPPPPPPPRGVDEQIRRSLAARVRAELSLTDAQVDALMPRIEALERARAEARRERIGLVRDLRRGVARGASDAELQALLDRLDALPAREDAATRAALAEIDKGLSVRQRVGLRFALARFRSEVGRRVEELREGRGAGGRGR